MNPPYSDESGDCGSVDLKGERKLKPMDEAVIVKKAYDDAPEREWNRLEGFRFEFEITKRKMEKYLKKGSVLDIGGGLPGVCIDPGIPSQKKGGDRAVFLCCQ